VSCRREPEKVRPPRPWAPAATAGWSGRCGPTLTCSGPKHRMQAGLRCCALRSHRHAQTSRCRLHAPDRNTAVDKTGARNAESRIALGVSDRSVQELAPERKPDRQPPSSATDYRSNRLFPLDLWRIAASPRQPQPSTFYAVFPFIFKAFCTQKKGRKKGSGVFFSKKRKTKVSGTFSDGKRFLTRMSLLCANPIPAAACGWHYILQYE
jgi:hypothetical protein